ncbi:hypothetical protein [Novosphingobium sp.]|uniref:hypothetical protein n=1 Tax=Novosphingobium sp. TaxID=1874826 RepID=UPI0031DF41B5
MVKPFGLQTEFAEIVTNGTTGFPAIAKPVGTEVAVGVTDVSALLLYPAAFDGDVGALLVCMCNSTGRRSRQHGS